MKKNLIKIQTNNLFSSSPLFTGKVSEKQHPAEPQAVWCWAAAQPAFFTLEANGVCTPKAADRDCLEKHDEGWLSAQSCGSSEGGQWLTPKVVVDVAAVRTESPALRRGVWCSKSGPSALPRSLWGLSLPLEVQSTPKRSQTHAGPGKRQKISCWPHLMWEQCQGSAAAIPLPQLLCSLRRVSPTSSTSEKIVHSWRPGRWDQYVFFCYKELPLLFLLMTLYKSAFDLARSYQTQLSFPFCPMLSGTEGLFAHSQNEVWALTPGGISEQRGKDGLCPGTRVGSSV